MSTLKLEDLPPEMGDIERPRGVTRILKTIRVAPRDLKWARRLSERRPDKYTLTHDGRLIKWLP